MSRTCDILSKSITIATIFIFGLSLMILGIISTNSSLSKMNNDSAVYSWDVGFNDPVYEKNEMNPVIDVYGTHINYSLSFKEYGSSYSFYVDAYNAGTFNALLTSIDAIIDKDLGDYNGVNYNFNKYAYITITDEEGNSLGDDFRLNMGDNKRINVSINMVDKNSLTDDEVSALETYLGINNSVTLSGDINFNYRQIG